MEDNKPLETPQENESKKYLDYEGLSHYDERIKAYFKFKTQQALSWGELGEE